MHYSRVIENQLDAIHLPFVHYNTIGRGNRRLVDGPFAKWADDKNDPDRMDIWVHNRVDDGSLPIKPSEISQPDRHPSLQFQIPNVWQNWISDTKRIVKAFVPMDNENTILLIRTYQKVSRIPLFKEIFYLSTSIGSFVIERQDRRVVITQRPYRTYNRMGETLLRGDAPVTLYRRKRENLIKVAGKTLEDI